MTLLVFRLPSTYCLSRFHGIYLHVIYVLYVFLCDSCLGFFTHGRSYWVTIRRVIYVYIRIFMGFQGEEIQAACQAQLVARILVISTVLRQISTDGWSFCHL